MTMKFRFQRKYLSLPYILFFLFFIILPVFIIIYYSFTDNNGQFSLEAAKIFFTSPERAGVLLLSFVYAVANTILCLLIGYPIAMILANKKYNKNAVIVLLFIMPMWVNFVIRTWATKDLLFWMGIHAGNYPGVAIMVGFVYNYLPFVILPLYTTMLKMDKHQIEASQDLGATPIQTFFKVIIPLSMPGIIAGATMVFMPTLSSQVIPNILSDFTVMLFGEAIYDTFTSTHPLNWNIGSFMALIMLILIGISIVITRRLGKKDQGDKVAIW
jgi:spermidine/putrescine transport system permease protein